MSRARRGDRPDPAVPRDRFEDWAAERVARLLVEAGIAVVDVTSLRVRPAGEAHEWIADTITHGMVILRDAALGYAAAYGNLSHEYLAELAGTIRLARGRPPGIADITDDDRLRETIADMDRSGFVVRRATLAAHAGYSESALRNYLRRTNRTLGQLLAQLRS